MYKDVLEDLKLEYDRRERASESLTRKSQHLVTVSAIMATLVTGFFGALLQLAIVDDKPLLQGKLVTELFRTLQLDQSNMDIVLIGFWSIPVILLLIAIVIACVKLNSAEDQKTIFLGARLTNNSRTNFKIIDSWAKLNGEQYDREIIKESYNA